MNHNSTSQTKYKYIYIYIFFIDIYIYIYLNIVSWILHFLYKTNNIPIPFPQATERCFRLLRSPLILILDCEVGSFCGEADLSGA